MTYRTTLDRPSPSPFDTGQDQVRFALFDEGPIPLYVSFWERGVNFVRSAQSVGNSPREFARSYYRRFGEEVEPAESPSPEIQLALASGNSSDLRFDLRGLGRFQKEVLEALRRIPRGEARSYRWVAGQVGRPTAVRAVGTALGRNPVPVLLPCHRVLRSDGSLGGYAFGIEVKQKLLVAEGVALS